ncbi:MAG TPA: TIGR00730 family Rossman fold protein [Candidatus Paceibacterota bacterium]
MNESTKDLLTLKEMHEASQARVHEIAREFTQGFKFLEKFGGSVSFFGSARTTLNELYYEDARKLAGRIAKELKYSIITGGGPGIMEAANRGAKEAGGRSVGLTIRLSQGQTTNPYLTDHLDFYYFFARKVCLTFASEAFVFYPGGLGSIDELTEVLTLIQSRKIEGVPVFLVGSEYWNSFDAFIKETLLKRKLIDQDDIAIYGITDDHEDIIRTIKGMPVRKWLPFVADGGLPEKPKKLTERHCEPCDKKTPPITKEKAEELIGVLNHWRLNDNASIEKSLKFENFQKALDFVNAVGEIAEAEGHHPDIALTGWNNVKITLTTHAIGALSENDFILASKIDDYLKENA